MPIAGKTGIVELNPNPQTILFAGKYINLSAIARTQNIDKSSLSRIFAGKRTPSLRMAQKIAAVLGIGLDELTEGLEIRAKEVREIERRILQAHNDRLDREVREDLKTLEKGGTPIPRLPLSA